MSSHQFSGKPKLQRLRASCDGCFNAKVKCSKSRPICSRCLACGTDCNYSPSSRAGKPRTDARRPSQHNIHTMNNNDPMRDDTITSTFVYASRATSIGSESQDSPLFNFDTNWPTASCSPDASIHSASSSATPLFCGDILNMKPINLRSRVNESYDPSFSCLLDPRAEFVTSTGVENGSNVLRSKSLQSVPQQSSHTLYDNSSNGPSFQQAELMDSATFNEFSSYPPDSALDIFTNSGKTGCVCFQTCLESLQALHSHLNSAEVFPPFDIVLTINRKAVESCAMMLGCTCIQTSGLNSTTMLLATILSKTMSFYREAAEHYFGFSSAGQSQNRPLCLMYGSYQVAGEDGRWLEMEILSRELRKLEELISKFQNTCGKDSLMLGEKSEDRSVRTTLTNHLGQELIFTLETIKKKETDFGQSSR